MAKQKRKDPAAVRLGRRGGSKGTPAQVAARALGPLYGGRSRRVCDTCGEPVFGFHIDRKRDDTCGTGPGWHWQKPSERPAKKAKR